MKTVFNAVIIAGLAIAALCGLAVSCAENSLYFSVDKERYFNGDTIQFSITSKGIYNYQWEIDGNKLVTNKKNRSFATDHAGNYEIVLKGYSRLGRQLKESRKTISVEKSKGKMAVFSRDTTIKNITLEVDNAFNVFLFQKPGCIPDCSVGSCSYLLLEEGIHRFKVTANGKSMEASLNVSANSCNSWEVF